MKISLSPRHFGGKIFSRRPSAPSYGVEITPGGNGRRRPSHRAAITFRRATFYSVGLIWVGHQVAQAQAPAPPTSTLPPLTAIPPGAPGNNAPFVGPARGSLPPAPAPPSRGTARPVAPIVPATPTPATAPAVPPVVPGLNILIVAFDEVSPIPYSPRAPLPVPATTGPLAPLTVPPASLPNLPPAVVPAPGNSQPFPAPAAWQKPVAFWQGFAQKKKAKDKDDNLFLPIPEPSNSTIGRKSRDEAADIARDAANKGLLGPRPAAGTAVAGTVTSAPGTGPGTGLGSTFPSALSGPSSPAGRSQQAALALRRALMARGYPDIMTTGPDGMSVARAQAERRLTPRVSDELKRGLASVAVPGPIDQKALLASTQAAARMGQALGYQGVIALYVAPPVAQPDGTMHSAWNMVLVDSTRERGEAVLYDEGAPVTGGNEQTLLDAGAATGAALLDKSLQKWLPPSNADKVGLAVGHLDAARAALAAGDTERVQDELNQTIALDPSQGDAYVLLGDALKDTDPQGAAVAYKRAVDLNVRDGATWAKIAAAYANAPQPDWPRALDAGRKSLATGYDSVELRVAMATAQYGRSMLFRAADRPAQADDAENEAKSHLDRALAIAPDDPSAIRLLANTLIAQGRITEAIQTLDRVAPRFPNDAEVQGQYARALSRQAGREEDAFVAYSRVWKQTGQKSVPVDATSYRALAQGFDLRLFNLGKLATQLTSGVATGAVAREAALLQLSKLKEDMTDTETAINTIQAPLTVSATTSMSRINAADLMSQSLEAYQNYLDTGQSVYRSRGFELYRQSVGRLNVARNTG